MADRKNMDQITNTLSAFLGTERLIGRNAAGDFKALVSTLLDYMQDNLSFPSAASPAGVILPYVSATAPSGWLNCQGETIGAVGSGADYESASYETIFNYCKAGFSNAGTESFAGNDTVKLPDMKGIFPSGAGASGVLTNANGAAFTRTFGVYQNDKLQGHKLQGNITSTLAVYGGDNYVALSANVGASETFENHVAEQGLVTDGSNGNPRIGTETNPANVALYYIIKI